MKPYKELLKSGLWRNNPILRLALGLCSTLAVTNFVKNTVIMSISVTITLIINSITVSALRKIIPVKIRMITYMIITSTIVILIDILLKIYFPDISKELGPYVPLIITNCIIMGRSEAFAIKNSIGKSFIDAVAMGAGYSGALIILSIVRELIGAGSFWGIKIESNIEPIELFSIPPGAFFTLGLLIFVVNKISKKRSDKSE